MYIYFFTFFPLFSEKKKNNQDEEKERLASIDVPAPKAVKFVMQLLMVQQGESVSRAAAAAAAEAAESSSSSSSGKKEEGEDEEEAKEKENGQDNTPEKVNIYGAPRVLFVLFDDGGVGWCDLRWL